MNTVTINIQRIAETLLVSYQWNSTERHLDYCSATELLIGEEAMNEVRALMEKMATEQNITKHVK